MTSRSMAVVVTGACVVVVGALAVYLALQAHIDLGVPATPPPVSGARG